MSKFRGTYNEDGSVKEWPEFDIMGGQYVRPASTKRLKDPSNPSARATQFVVLPPGFNDFEHMFTILVETEQRHVEQTAQAEADYQRTNAEAIRKEAEAQRAVLGNTAPVVERPSVVAPVMIEQDTKTSKSNRGIVPNDADA